MPSLRDVIKAADEALNIIKALEMPDKEKRSDKTRDKKVGRTSGRIPERFKDQISLQINLIQNILNRKGVEDDVANQQAIDEINAVVSYARTFNDLINPFSSLRDTSNKNLKKMVDALREIYSPAINNTGKVEDAYFIGIAKEFLNTILEDWGFFCDLISLAIEQENRLEQTDKEFLYAFLSDIKNKPFLPDYYSRVYLDKYDYIDPKTLEQAWFENIESEIKAHQKRLLKQQKNGISSEQSVMAESVIEEALVNIKNERNSMQTEQPGTFEEHWAVFKRVEEIKKTVIEKLTTNLQSRKKVTIKEPEKTEEEIMQEALDYAEKFLERYLANPDDNIEENKEPDTIRETAFQILWQHAAWREMLMPFLEGNTNFYTNTKGSIQYKINIFIQKKASQKAEEIENIVANERTENVRSILQESLKFLVTNETSLDQKGSRKIYLGNIFENEIRESTINLLREQFLENKEILLILDDILIDREKYQNDNFFHGIFSEELSVDIKRVDEILRLAGIGVVSQPIESDSNTENLRKISTELQNIFKTSDWDMLLRRRDFLEKLAEMLNNENKLSPNEMKPFFALKGNWFKRSDLFDLFVIKLREIRSPSSVLDQKSCADTLIDYHRRFPCFSSFFQTTSRKTLENNVNLNVANLQKT